MKSNIIDPRFTSESFKKGIEAFFLENFPAMREHLEAVPNPAPSILTDVLQGIALKRTGNIKEGTRKIEEATQREPVSAYDNIGLAWAEYENGNTSRSLTYLATEPVKKFEKSNDFHTLASTKLLEAMLYEQNGDYYKAALCSASHVFFWVKESPLSGIANDRMEELKRKNLDSQATKQDNESGFVKEFAKCFVELENGNNSILIKNNIQNQIETLCGFQRGKYFRSAWENNPKSITKYILTGEFYEHLHSRKGINIDGTVNYEMVFDTVLSERTKDAINTAREEYKNKWRSLINASGKELYI